MLRRNCAGAATVAVATASGDIKVTRRSLSTYTPKAGYWQHFVPVEQVSPPADSYLATNKEGIDEMAMSFKNQVYFRDCYFKEVPIPFQAMEIVRRETTAKREFAEYFLLHYANLFVLAQPFKLEHSLINLVVGKRRPRDEKFWSFNVGDELGIWKVVHRSAQEICMEWSAGGIRGRTYFAVQTNNESPEQLRLLFGSGIWPYGGKGNALEKLGTTATDSEVRHRYNTESMFHKYLVNGPRRKFWEMTDRLHAEYSKILLGRAATKFYNSWNDPNGVSILEYGTAVTKVKRASLPDTAESRRLNKALAASAIPITTSALCKHPNLVLRKVAQCALRTPLKVALVLDDLDEDHTAIGVTYFELLDRSVYWATQMAQKKNPSDGLFRSKNSSSSSGGGGKLQKDESGDFNVMIVDSPGASFVYSLLATWILEGMAIPTCSQHKLETEISHVIQDSKSSNMFYSDRTVSKLLGKNETEWDKVMSPLSKGEEEESSSDATTETKVVTVESLMEEHLKEFLTKATEACNETAAPTTAATDNKPASDSGMRIKSVVRVAEGTVPQKDREQLYGNLPTAEDDALLIYTSGTTAKPKGAVHTHASVSNQVATLIEAWGWKPQDRLLNVLPFHHVHGLVNGLFCALGVGATCIISPFNVKGVVRALGFGKISLFFAVPAVYSRLIDYLETDMNLGADYLVHWKRIVTSQVRLMVSGSSALPVPFIEKWRQLSGTTLLERYGMTEIGMALSQPLRPIKDRLPGTVGYALRSVKTRVEQPLDGAENDNRNDITGTGDKHDVTEPCDGGAVVATENNSSSSFQQKGELLVSSPSVFDRYWRNPEATAKEFVTIMGKSEFSGNEVEERWFRTGDTVGMNLIAGRNALTTSSSSSSDATTEGGEGDGGGGASPSSAATPAVEVFTILGRSSVDIIKSSGYKLSALEIESALLLDPTPVLECAVYGVPDNTVGERVIAVVALKEDIDEKWTTSEALKALAAQRMAKYKQPSVFHIVPVIPRNPMGKVNKKELRAAMEVKK